MTELQCLKLEFPSMTVVIVPALGFSRGSGKVNDSSAWGEKPTVLGEELALTITIDPDPWI